MSTNLDAQVVIVGGGPVGLVAALALHQRGISVIVIESEPDEVRAEWRGSTLHPPTLEIFDGLGISGPILRDGIRLERMVYRDLELETEASFPYELLSEFTRFPFRLQYEQYKVLRLLKDTLASSNIPVLYESTVMEFDQDDRSVTATVMTQESSRSISSEWLLAADGAHSMVRKALNIEFRGSTYPTQSLVVATPFPFERYVKDLPPVSYWSGPRGRISIIRTPDIWRTAITTNLGTDDSYEYRGNNPHPSFTDRMNLLLGDAVDPLSFDIRQHQFFRSHQRLASTFRSGRVLLAGDAAHLTSTTGGMGLNSGVHDAHQLALAFEQDDLDASLNAYAEGRRSIAETMVQPITTANRLGTDLLDREHRQARLDELRHKASRPDTARAHLYASAMLDTAGL